jgi:hypothetical protein
VCIDCSKIVTRDKLLKTVDRCVDCEQIRIDERLKLFYKKHKYSTSVQAVRKRKYRSDPVYKLKDNIMSLISGSFSKNGFSKSARANDILGCSYDFFCVYIESKFVEGMSWDNKSSWQLDHIVPISLASSKEEIIFLNHYTNFQPLWTSVNISKRTTVDIKNKTYLKLLEMRNRAD